MIAIIAHAARVGYLASRSGSPRVVNPWAMGTVGGRAWDAGWSIGDLPPVVRAVVAWGLL